MNPAGGERKDQFFAITPNCARRNLPLPFLSSPPAATGGSSSSLSSLPKLQWIVLDKGGGRKAPLSNASHLHLIFSSLPRLSDKLLSHRWFLPLPSPCCSILKSPFFPLCMNWLPYIFFWKKRGRGKGLSSTARVSVSVFLG